MKISFFAQGWACKEYVAPLNKKHIGRYIEKWQKNGVSVLVGHDTFMEHIIIHLISLSIFMLLYFVPFPISFPLSAQFSFPNPPPPDLHLQGLPLVQRGGGAEQCHALNKNIYSKIQQICPLNVHGRVRSVLMCVCFEPLFVHACNHAPHFLPYISGHLHVIGGYEEREKEKGGSE